MWSICPLSVFLVPVFIPRSVSGLLLVAPLLVLCGSRELAGLRSGRWLAGRVGEQLNLDATVLRASGSGRVGRDFLILTDSDEIELVGRDVVL